MSKSSCAVCLRARRARATLPVTQAGPNTDTWTPKHPRFPWPCDGLLMPRCLTFKKHSKYCANRPGQLAASPPTSSASCQHPRQSLHHQSGRSSIPYIPASPASLKPFKNGPLRVGFGGRRTWRTSLRSRGRLFLRKRGRRRCAENIAHTVFLFCIFPPVSVGLGRAAGDAFFGLIGFRCETRAARRTQAPDASRYTCAQARVVSVVLSSGGVGKQPCSLLCL